MNSNLASARQSIKAELSHARQGAAFYSARVEALETALSQLESVEIEEVDTPGKRQRRSEAEKPAKSGESKRGRKAKSAGQGTAGKTTRRAGQRGRKAQAANRPGDTEKLPTTGTDFWFKLVTDEPKTAVDIANAAVSFLGLKPDQKEQIKKLKQRVAPALMSLLSTQKIRDEGFGRQRRFFKEEGESMH